VLVKRANGSAVAVLRMLASDFSSYRDGRVFAGKFVWFLKRAQIFVADVWAAFEGEVLKSKLSFFFFFFFFFSRFVLFVSPRLLQSQQTQGLGRFDDIDSLTMFADYRVPQQLCALGVLRYSERLRKILENESKELTPDLEAEIRGCSIEAVERLRVPGVNAIQIDFWLWDEAKARTDIAHIPIHKLRTIFY
jgi:hypothetical protein